MVKEVEKKESSVGDALVEELAAMNDVASDEDEEKKDGPEEEEENDEEDEEDDSGDEDEDDEDDDEGDVVDEDKSSKSDPVLKDISDKLDALALKPEEPDEESKGPDLESELDFLEDVDMEAVTSDKTIFNKVLNMVVKVAHDRGRVSGAAEAKESIFRSLPSLIANNTSQRDDIKKATMAFYKSNPDLEPWRHAVAAAVNEVASKDPGKSLGDLLVEGEKLVRKRLKLKKKAVEKSSGTKGPKFGKTSSGGKSKKKGESNLTKTESEISEMNNSNT